MLAIFFRATGNKHARFLLSLLLIDLSLIVFKIHYLMDFFIARAGNHFILSGPFMFLLGPLLFLYLRGIVLPESRFARKDFLHFVIFLIFFLQATLFFIYGEANDVAAFVKRIVGSPWIFLVLQFSWYLVHTHKLLRLHRKNIVDKFSNVEGMDVSWLKLITWLFAVILVFITIGAPSLIHGPGFSTYKTTASLFFSFVLFFIAYKGLQQRVPGLPTMHPENDGGKADDETIKKLSERLLAHMESSKPYLDPELTLVDLARQLEISRNQLSQVINAGVGDNFYNFINKFRVEEVKRLINHDSSRQYTILALASDAGFNSKSSFNSIFKKATGLTPSEYRNGQN